MVSNPERQRRYLDIRKAMQQKGFSALIVAGNSETLQRGYIRYLSDWRLWGGTGYMVFLLESEPVLILGKGSQYYWAMQRDWVTDVRAGQNKVEECIKFSRNDIWQTKKLVWLD